jgi:DNA primase
MFGFDEKFLDFESHSQCPPIVICEGSKDCIFMKQFYPYVLSINTSSMGLNAQVLLNLTNKFILAYDNDKAGQEGIERDKRILRSYGSQVTSLELSKSKDINGKLLIKDCSDYIKYPDKIKELKEELNYKLCRVTSF